MNPFLKVYSTDEPDAWLIALIEEGDKEASDRLVKIQPLLYRQSRTENSREL